LPWIGLEPDLLADGEFVNRHALRHVALWSGRSRRQFLP
jgi:hypothetical protein